MDSPVTICTSVNPVTQFETFSCIIRKKFGLHADLVEATKIYDQLVKVRQRLAMCEEWLKTDTTAIKKVF